jgi:hypothetical protein
MNLLKKSLTALLFISFAFISLSAQAQPDENKEKRQKKIKALYVAFVTQELNLTETEAQQFWPIHGEYENEIKGINEKKLPELEREESVLNVKKKYVDRFKKIIGAERTDSFFRKDGEFRKKLIERIKEHRRQNGPGPGGKRRQGMEPPPPPED